jgi:TPR repeat protein
MKSTKHILGVLTIFLWSLPCLVSAGYQEGRDAFDRMDYPTALKEFKELADQNDALGQYGLGVMYDLGGGVPQSSEEAAKWYRLAAEQGNADAQNNLGAMYESGEGLPQDSKEAVKWYRRAAEGGNFDAPNNLGAMYLTGIGVPRDYVRAHMWFDLALLRKDRAAAKNMSFVMKKMSQDQIAEARKLAKDWMEIYENRAYQSRWKRLR